MKIFGSKVGFAQLAILGNVGKESWAMLAKNLEQSWEMLVKKIIMWRCGDDGKMKDEDLFVQSWLYVHMIYELLR